MANKNLFQLYAEREAIPGNLESGLVAIANAKFKIKDPQFTPSTESFAREVLGGGLSPVGQLVGKTSFEASFACELAGSTVASTAPTWGLLLEACGFKQVTIFGGVWSGGFTGTATGTARYLHHGQLLTGTSGAVLRVVHDTYENSAAVAGSRAITYESVSGTPTTEAYWPSTSDSTIGPVLTITDGQPATAKGFAWYPVSTSILSLATTGSATGTVAADDILLGATSGAVLQAISAVTTAGTYTFRVLDGAPAAAGETMNNKTQTGSFAISGTPAYSQTQFPTLSLGLCEDSRVKKAKGCRGTVSLSAELGKPVYMNFKFSGAYGAVVDGGPLSGVAFENKTPKGFMGIGCLLGSFTSTEPGYFKHDTAHTPRIDKFTMDLGGSANLQSDATATAGTGSVAFATNLRTSQGSMSISLRPEASFPVVKKFQASEEIWWRMRIPGGANNVFLISTPGMVVTGIGQSDENSLVLDDLSVALKSVTPALADRDGNEIVISYHYSASSTW